MKIRTIACLPLLLIASALQAEQPQLEALEAWADAGAGLIMIRGRNFDNGSVLEVQIAGRLPVEIVDPPADYIEIPLPPDLEPGTHTIFISTGGGTIRYDDIDFTWGAVGLQGLPGEQGIQGIQGLKGDTGDTGPQGDKGETGDTGLPGADGEDGAPGPQGDDGPQGIQGIQGDKGDTGNIGPPGPPGPPGAPGRDGLDGENGVDLTNEICLLYQIVDTAPPQTLACVFGQCSDDSQCPDDTWCRPTSADPSQNECVPFAQVGESCGGFTPAWAFQRCAAGLICGDFPPDLADAPGICIDPNACTPDQFEPNETGFTAYDLGVLRDTSGDMSTVTGNIAEGDSDWYQFTAEDGSDLGSDSFAVDVRLATNPGAQFSMRVFRGSLQLQNLVCGDGSTGVGGVCIGNAIQYINPGAAGTDDTAVYFVEVLRDPSMVPTCDSYTLEVSNGIYDVDQDGDGFASALLGGTDCNDLDGSVYPGQTASFVFPSAQSFDYNCDGVEEPSPYGGLLCDFDSGPRPDDCWDQETVPACGETGLYIYSWDRCGVFNTEWCRNDGVETQSCR